MTRIQWYRKNVYGEEKIYIANEGARVAVAVMTRRKTIFPSDLAALRDLGLETVEVLAPGSPGARIPALAFRAGRPAQETR